ncbi:hypothetical protein GCM10010112_49320 [Actinoplanes lobatus]|uniref:Choline dehydrogenase-like flavoprotein n=1 Tax=Actinoplanes lobatus TaxID=113568 RepID=A0A7W7HP22_9ACTN|nr:GMC oxidoreductase [Actinoplanes lobatus]MBB4754091.1 choline dehydrogenase-like flavoprotein [Actinoplanes lobatus]GGN76814.1 hypothetical protein GCM10010112_49320 [Actinoplanes lobatus]GIE40853.1 hypothetical protein Alo02nite_37510 [Actinoplanes lobatus]
MTRPVDETAFSTDVFGRFLCRTWNEAIGGGDPFDVVVLGAGTYGAYCAAELVKAGRRVLLLDAGPVVLPEHIQNIGDLDLHIPRPDREPSGVWRVPWRGNEKSPGLAYCAGGRSIFFGGWLARLTAEDLSEWPKEVAADLEAGYPLLERATGVEPAWDLVDGRLHKTLLAMVRTAAGQTPNLDAHTVQTAPLAVQAAPPESGLLSFDKFSTVPVLAAAVRAYGKMLLNFVPRATVLRLWHGGGVVRAIDVALPSRRERLHIPPSCRVVLALGAVESTRLALNSFPTPLMGRNLMIHVRSDLITRVHRSALPGLAEPHIDVATILARGRADSGRFHLQITASTGSGSRIDEPLFQMVPDLDQLERIREQVDPDWVTVVVRTVGETHGDREAPAGSPGGNWITVDPAWPDEFGVPTAYVNLRLRPEDLRTWDAMDTAAVGLLRALVPDPEKIRYWYDGRWRRTPFPVGAGGLLEWRNWLGYTHHEAGLMWMGEDPATSVTDSVGRFHHLRNAYACDGSIFPTVGSVGPVLTGLTLARRLATRL